MFLLIRLLRITVSDGLLQLRLPSSSDSAPTSVRSRWSSRSTGSLGSGDGQGGTAQVHVMRVAFRSRTIARLSVSGTAARPIAGARARPPAKPRWMARPSNNDYFSGPVHVARVQAWRAAHPGYSRGRARSPRALQDLFTPQVPDAIEECADRVEAPEVGAPVALQDDMASTTRRLVQLGRDVINGRCGEAHQAATSARAAAPGPAAVQLG